MTTRRDFISTTSAAAGMALLSRNGRPVTSFAGLITPLPTADKKALADVALNTARSKGASYADVRIGRYLNEAVFSRDRMIQGVQSTESYGAGVRVLLDGTWGFAATDVVTPEGIALAAASAIAIAKANSKLGSRRVELAPQRGYGEVAWKAPIEKNAFSVPIAEKASLLTAAGDAALKAGASFLDGALFVVNEQKYFASTDGSYIDQDVHRLWPVFTATYVDAKSGKFETRDSLSTPVGMGWEYLSIRPQDKITGPAGVLYGNRYDLVADAAQAARDAKAKLTATSVTPGKYDLVLEPAHMWLTIHESVGHPTELDRVLGYEANFAGTSFATLDKWKSGTFKYGSPLMNIVADKTQQGSLGAVGYDDEGVKTKEWDIIKDGILVNYQAIRDQVGVLGQTESHGCCYADAWDSVQFQRMPNISLRPGKAPLTPTELIAKVERGIYIVGAGSFSIDQQRYNFQFGGQTFHEIKNGKLAGPLKDVAYQSNTTEFWNSLTSVCDGRDYRLGGSFFDGKGQPSQSSAVSHGSSTVRFNGVNVINTARKI
ncbi:MAG: TldD/PmbA family protein [Gemmatimonadales bacterium]